MIAAKAALLNACRADPLQGAGTDAEGIATIEGLMDELALLNPTPNPASDPRLCGRWEP